MIFTCDELLVTGTAAKVAYAQSVDDRPIAHAQNGPGPLCKGLQDEFERFINMDHPRSKEWMYEIELSIRLIFEICPASL